jgi:hypothetical protein
MRKDIARVNTVVREKQLTGGKGKAEAAPVAEKPMKVKAATKAKKPVATKKAAKTKTAATEKK